LRKDAARLLRTNNWFAAAKYKNQWREKTAYAVARKRAGDPLEKVTEGQRKTTGNLRIISATTEIKIRNPDNFVGYVTSSTVSLSLSLSLSDLRNSDVPRR